MMNYTINQHKCANTNAYTCTFFVWIWFCVRIFRVHIVKRLSSHIPQRLRFSLFVHHHKPNTLRSTPLSYIISITLPTGVSRTTTRVQVIVAVTHSQISVERFSRIVCCCEIVVFFSWYLLKTTFVVVVQWENRNPIEEALNQIACVILSWLWKFIYDKQTTDVLVPNYVTHKNPHSAFIFTTYRTIVPPVIVDIIRRR